MCYNIPAGCLPCNNIMLYIIHCVQKDHKSVASIAVTPGPIRLDVTGHPTTSSPLRLRWVNAYFLWASYKEDWVQWGVSSPKILCVTDSTGTFIGELKDRKTRRVTSLVPSLGTRLRVAWLCNLVPRLIIVLWRRLGTREVCWLGAMQHGCGRRVDAQAFDGGGRQRWRWPADHVPHEDVHTMVQQQWTQRAGERGNVPENPLHFRWAPI